MTIHDSILVFPEYQKRVSSAIKRVCYQKLRIVPKTKFKDHSQETYQAWLLSQERFWKNLNQPFTRTEEELEEEWLEMNQLYEELKSEKIF